MQLGADSLDLRGLSEEISAVISTSLSPITLLEYHNFGSLCKHLVAQVPEELGQCADDRVLLNRLTPIFLS